MEKKMNVAEFATLVGTTSKTIYGKINNYDNLPVNERLKTVSEKVKGREVTLIITNSEQIEFYKNLYGKDTVIDGEYYETVTDNNGLELVNEVHETRKTTNTLKMSDDAFERLLTLNESYNNRIEHYNNELLKAYNELSEVKSKQLLLEDKAGREGLLLNEIRELKEANNKELEILKKENNRNKLYNKLLITVITILLLFITGFITYNIAKNNTVSDTEIEKSVQVEEKSEQVSAQVEQKAEPKPQPVKRTVQRKR